MLITFFRIDIPQISAHLPILHIYLLANDRSLSILVTVEMFNALNALSERESLLVVKPWVNKWLILAIIVSFSQHFLVM